MKSPLRLGISAKLFLAIFSTCMLVLITMHWGVLLSFEHGFVDYIKRGNEQRLAILGDALADQYEQHGNWDFLRHNDRLVFTMLRSLEQNPDSNNQLPPHGWRTQFWIIDQGIGWPARAGAAGGLAAQYHHQQRQNRRLRRGFATGAPDAQHRY